MANSASDAPPSSANRRWQRWIIAGCALGFVGILFRILQIDGWIRPVMITGPSMAETLWGPHWRLPCDHCRLETRVVIPAKGLPKTWQCGNCGTRQDIGEAKHHPGQLVVIDRAAYWFRSPKRDELVAVQDPQGELRVKRVVGLPSEEVEFREGDLWIDGIRIQKTLSQLRQRAVLVYDDRHPTGRARWTSTSIHQRIDAGFIFPTASDGVTVRYQHYAMTQRGSWGPSGVLDDDVCNQHVSRRLFPVADLMLHATLQADAPVEVTVSFWNAIRPVSCRFSTTTPTSRWQVAWLDQQLWLSLNGSQSIATSLDASLDLVTRDRPIAVQLRSVERMELKDLVIHRDLELSGPTHFPRAWKAPRLGPDRYFLLGDNLSVSVDSRVLPRGVQRIDIVGQVTSE